MGARVRAAIALKLGNAQAAVEGAEASRNVATHAWLLYIRGIASLSFAEPQKIRKRDCSKAHSCTVLSLPILRPHSASPALSRPPSRLLRQDYVAPVNTATLVRVRNTTGKPISIERLQLSAQGDDGSWVNLASIRLPGKVYCCTPKRDRLNSVHEIEFEGGGLIRVLASRAIGPAEVITNWALFEYPPDKLTLQDQDGNTYESATGSSSVKQDVDPTKIPELEELVFKAVHRPPTDLSRIRIGHLADE